MNNQIKSDNMTPKPHLLGAAPGSALDMAPDYDKLVFDMDSDKPNVLIKMGGITKGFWKNEILVLLNALHDKIRDEEGGIVKVGFEQY